MPLVPIAVKPLPVHEVAFVADHESVDELPLTIVVGLAENVSVGAGVEVDTEPDDAPEAPIL